jgi:hypothetical protein
MPQTHLNSVQSQMRVFGPVSKGGTRFESRGVDAISRCTGPTSPTSPFQRRQTTPRTLFPCKISFPGKNGISLHKSLLTPSSDGAPSFHFLTAHFFQGAQLRLLLRLWRGGRLAGGGNNILHAHVGDQIAVVFHAVHIVAVSTSSLGVSPPKSFTVCLPDASVIVP